MKNFAMVGGLFFLMLHGAGKMSLDHLIEKIIQNEKQHTGCCFFIYKKVRCGRYFF